MANPIPRFSEGNKVEFTDKVSIWLNRAAGFFSKDARPTTPSDFSAAQREYALLLTWTPDPKADFYNLYVSSTNDVNAKLLVGKLYGDVSSFLHYIGVVGTRYYWLEAGTNTGRIGELVQSFGTSTGLTGAVPTGHATSHENGGSDEIDVTGLSGVLADDQNPVAHNTSHQSGGSDEIKLDDLKAPDDNTDLNASTTKHGLLPKLSGVSTEFLNGDGDWATPAGGGGGGGSQYAVRVYRSSTQTISTSTSTAISFDTEIYDHGSMWAVGNPTRLVAPVDGIYQVTCCVQWVANGTGTRYQFFKKNGTTDIGQGHAAKPDAGADQFNRYNYSAEFELEAGDYIECIVNQGSGGNLDLMNVAEFFPVATMHLVGQATGGSGDETTTAAYASRPTASNDGDLFLPSDGIYLERDTGAAYESWGPIYKLTPPNNADFSDVNIGSAVVTTSRGGIHMSCASNGGSHSFRMRAKSLPSAPYTLTAAVIPLLFKDDHSQVVIGLRDSASSKLIVFRIMSLSGVSMAWENWTNETTFSGAHFSLVASSMPRPILFLRIQDDNTNRILSWSATGIEESFQQLHSVGRTDFLTPNQFVFGVNPFSQRADLTLLSLKQS
jgi:hypothetical protein